MDTIIVHRVTPFLVMVFNILVEFQTPWTSDLFFYGHSFCRVKNFGYVWGLSLMKITKFIIVLIAIFGAFSCDKESAGPNRSFYMGFTPFPYAISLEAVDYTYEMIAQEADIINHHFDNGVPWVEALQNAPFHINIQNDW